MIFAYSFDILMDKYGFPGLVLAAVWLLFAFLFKEWIKASERDSERKLTASEREHERKLKSLEAEHIKRLELLNKRDEIRFSKLHEKRAMIIADIFTRLVDIQMEGIEALSNSRNINHDK